MADYFPVLSRAVAQLETNTGEARRAVYERARAAIVRQLRAIDPPLSEEDISRERMQLEEAIRRVEAGAGGAPQPAPTPAPAPAPAAPPPPKPAEPAAAERPEPAAAQRPREDIRQERREARQERGEGGGKKAARRAEQQAARAAGQPAPRPAEPAEAAATVRPAKRADGRPIIQAAGAPAAERGRKRSGPLIALGVVAAIAIAGGLYLALRGQTPGTVAEAPPAAPTETARTETGTPPSGAAAPGASEDGKSDDRLPQDGASAERVPAEPAAPAAQPPAEPPASAPPPPAQQEVARGPEPTAPAPSPQPTPPATTAPGEPGPLVAQRAVLYEEGPNQQSGEALQGTVVWRTESVSGGPNQPLETALRGEIDIPGRRLRSTVTIRRNTDATLPASHTIEIQFTLPDDFPNAGISNVPGVLMKADEAARGSAVAGLSVRVTNGFFLIGLSNLDTERTVNEQLLRDRGWIDIPILYDNGRRAVLTLEKGTPGTQAFQEAFAAWRSASASGSPAQ